MLMDGYEAGEFFSELESFMAGFFDTRGSSIEPGGKFIFETPGVPNKTKFRLTIEVIEDCDSYE